MARESDLHSANTKRVAVGLSSVIGITLMPGQAALLLKYFSGGTLELVSGSTTSPWGLGYVFGTSEVLQLNGVGTFYLCATGATVTAMVIQPRSAGFEPG